MIGKINFSRGLFVLICCLFLTGCLDSTLKLFDGKKEECLPVTSIGAKLGWGTKFVQNTPIESGNLKFKFDITPNDSLAQIPLEYRFFFTHKDKRGRILFNPTWDLVTNANGSVPFQTVGINTFTFKKGESIFFELSPQDRVLPESDLTFTWKYRKLAPQIQGTSRLNAPGLFFEVEESHYIRFQKK